MKRSIKEIYFKYTEWLSRKPYVSNIITTGALMATGDAIAQNVFSNEKYDPVRTAKMTLLGVTFVAPTILTFYRTMEKTIGPSKPLLKVLVDQGIFTPCFITVFMTSLDLLNHHDLNHIKKHLENDYWTVLKTNWTFWPAVQIINFTVMPPYARVLVVQSVALMWNTYLAWKLHQDFDDQTQNKPLVLKDTKE